MQPRIRRSDLIGKQKKEQPNSMLNDYITPTNFSANIRQINKQEQADQEPTTTN